MSITRDDTQLIPVVTCDTVQDLLTCLLPTYDLWASPHNYAWLFRGQGDADWHLQPRVFRDSARRSYRPGQNRRYEPHQWLVEQEYQMVCDFLLLADRAGLRVPSEAHAMMTNRELRPKGADNEEILRQWPPIGMHQAMALAQHHGVPTRLLDFTINPLIAAYFAVMHERPSQGGSEFFCVWALNRFNLFNYVGRYREVFAPRYANANLNEQEAVFLLDEQANAQLFSSGEVAPMDQVVSETLERLSTANAGTYAVAHPILTKIRAPITERKRVIVAMNRMGFNKARLMPSYDSVVETLEYFCDHDMTAT